jgi:hypothetical protein
MHLLMILLILLIVVERLLKRFDKIPFTCSYLPGKANLKATFGWYWVCFTILTFLITNLETWLLAQPGQYAVAVVLLSAWLWGEMRARRGDDSEASVFTYEQRPDWEPITLELRR